MNPYDEKDRQRLFTAIEKSYRSLEPFRNVTRQLVAEYAGNSYGHGGQKEQLLNLINQTVNAYQLALVANRPRILLSTRHTELNYFAQQFELATNNFIEEIRLEETLKKWVLDAFFCLGIIKVHLADSGPVELESGVLMDPGMPFASNVSLDNWVHDQSATTYSECKFAGDAYRIPYEDLKSSLYDQEAVKDIKPTTKFFADDEKLAAISKGNEVDGDEFEPMVDLMDVWVSRDNKIYTFAVDNTQFMQCKGPPVAVMEWDGPEFGPYHLLGFDDVPQNIMPASPASQLTNMSRLVNNIMRKQARRAKNAKVVHCFAPGSESGASRVQNAGDDSFQMVEQPDLLKSLPIGGVDPISMQFLEGVNAMFDRMAGNLTAMLGLGAQADTASQESLIHGAVSKKEAGMQYKVVDGTKRLIRDLGYMLWQDKVKVIPGRLPIEGAEGYSVDATWSPEDREGDFFDYNFDIDVHSMPYQSPSQRINSLMRILNETVMPGAQMLMSQGGTINFSAIIDTLAELTNEPRLKEWIQFANAPLEPEPGMQGNQPPMPATTNRTYTRRSSGGPTAQGRSVQAQQGWAALAASNANQAV